jgi:hypothetical protein
MLLPMVQLKLHIEFTFHYRDPYGSGVKCPWIFYYKTYACNRFLSPLTITKSGALSDGFHHSCV